MEQKFMCWSKKLISFLCCISLVISVLFPNVNVLAGREGEDIVRYSVLILDTSGSMKGTPAEKQKEAADGNFNVIKIYSYSDI